MENKKKQIAWNKIFIINKSFLINVIHVQKYGLLILSRLLLSYFCSIPYFVSRFPYLSSASLFLNVFTIIWFQFQNTVRSDFLHNFSNSFTLPLLPLLKLIRASKLETSVLSYQKEDPGYQIKDVDHWTRCVFARWVHFYAIGYVYLFFITSCTIFNILLFLWLPFTLPDFAMWKCVNDFFIVEYTVCKFLFSLTNSITVLSWQHDRVNPLVLLCLKRLLILARC